jgi:CheY-like chemotaxis protein
MATVLLVEDNDDVREMMSLALQLGGHEVWSARHGGEALALLHERPLPSLILTDLMMPVMNGWELRAALRNDPELAEVPVVAVSAIPAEHIERLEGMEFLPKPIDIDRLLDVVCEHCRKTG